MSQISLVYDNFVDVIPPTISVNYTSSLYNHFVNLIEVYHLSITYTSSHFLLLCLISSFPILNKPSFHKIRTAAEICVLGLPFLAGVSILSPYTLWIPYSILSAAIYLLFMRNRVYVSFNWPEFVFQSKPVPTKSPLITNLYANTIMSVCISILAVDFHIFPQRFAKTKLYGYSIMDIGVSAFVGLNALLSREARSVESSSSSNIRKTIVGSSGLIFLGFLRLFLLAITGYGQEISEYGMHWNFFFSLAFTKIISSYLANRFSSPLFVAILLAFLHQILLSTIVGEVVFNPYRNGLILANKEGIFSLPGYVSLHLFFISLGKRYFQKRDRSSNLDTLFFIADVLFYIIIATIIGTFSHTFIDPSCRRLCNLAFISYSIVLICLIIVFELSTAILVDILQYLMVMKKAPFFRSYLNEALAKRGLTIFLFANILTGLVNLFLNPRSQNTLISFAINIIYLFTVCIFGLNSHLLITFKSILRSISANP